MELLKILVAAWSFAGVSLYLGLTFLWMPPAYADTLAGQSEPPASLLISDPITPTMSVADANPPIFPPGPLLAPANGQTISTPRSIFDWVDASDADGVISYTLRISGASTIWGQGLTATVTATNSIYTPTQSLPNGVYTWTVRAYDTVGNASAYVTPTTFTVEAMVQVFLPVVTRSECPVDSASTYDLIPIEGPPADRPDYLHGDLNLALRGFVPTTAVLDLININGAVDPNAPQLAGLLNPNQFPGISAAYHVYDWDWNCGANGCPGPIITDPTVTMIGLVTTPGEPIHIPERGPEIYGGGYKVMVLYADLKRITLNYTRRDSVAFGYTVHLEQVCVDPNLLALYRAQRNAAGFHVTGQLPALRNNQPLGTSLGTETQVVIRDRGTFMEPRSRKDWWWGF
jgi:hypothetical protein